MTLHSDAPSGRPDENRTALARTTPGEADDRLLLQLSRAGDTDAFAELFRRYRPFAVRVAARTSSRVDPDDASAEAFARVWHSLRAGGGPERTFTPYLAAAVRNVILNWSRRQETPIEPATLSEVIEDTGGGAAVEDTAIAISEASMVVRAFGTLPERWRTALWATEVEGRPVAELAEELRLSGNAASALCLRAREGLRVAWLQAHVEDSAEDTECRWVLERLGAHARGRLPKGQRTRVEAHLAECASCAGTSRRLAVIGGTLRTATLFAGTGVTLASLRALGFWGAGNTAAAATLGSGARRAARATLQHAAAPLHVGVAASAVTAAAVAVALGLPATSVAEQVTHVAAAPPVPTVASPTWTPTPTPTVEPPATPSATPTTREVTAGTTEPRATPASPRTSPSATTAPTPDASPTAGPTGTPTPTGTATPGPSATPDPSGTPSASPSASATTDPGTTATPSPTPTPTTSPTPTTPAPSPTPTRTPTPSVPPSPTPTAPTPTAPSPTPTCVVVAVDPLTGIRICVIVRA